MVLTMNDSTAALVTLCAMVAVLVCGAVAIVVILVTDAPFTPTDGVYGVTSYGLP